ncbi:hypothetical protein H072_449 [Dactylellina haptotyla CBS 200.50]|uniref:Uncharacterized protein n=1 Tax=Dactylellina haptotyla (strain CBS 200.50) TaxID=1284197 RepID=S8AX31_DACHA|nr:hypothetical protein H072_449 [Dactylellina haptotyla CBS 200.50]
MSSGESTGANLAALSDSKHATTSISKDYIGQLAEVVADAMLPSEMWALFFGGDANVADGERREKYLSVTKEYLHTGGRKVIIAEAGGFSACAAWWPPGSHLPPNDPESLNEQDHQGLGGSELMAAFEREVEKVRVEEIWDKYGQEYWHLGLLARDPTRPSVPGAVRAVLKPFIGKAAADRKPIWLSTTSLRAVNIYMHYGWETVRTITIERHTQYCMILYPPEPPITSGLFRLPPELAILNIGVFLSITDLLNLRLTCRMGNARFQEYFRSRFFHTRQHVLIPKSISRLCRLSEKPEIAQYVRRLRIGLEHPSNARPDSPYEFQTWKEWYVNEGSKLLREALARLNNLKTMVMFNGLPMKDDYWFLYDNKRHWDVVRGLTTSQVSHHLKRWKDYTLPNTYGDVLAAVLQGIARGDFAIETIRSVNNIMSPLKIGVSPKQFEEILKNAEALERNIEGLETLYLEVSGYDSECVANFGMEGKPTEWRSSLARLLNIIGGNLKELFLSFSGYDVEHIAEGPYSSRGSDGYFPPLSQPVVVNLPMVKKLGIYKLSCKEEDLRRFLGSLASTLRSLHLHMVYLKGDRTQQWWTIIRMLMDQFALRGTFLYKLGKSNDKPRKIIRRLAYPPYNVDAPYEIDETPYKWASPGDLENGERVPRIFWLAALNCIERWENESGYLQDPFSTSETDVWAEDDDETSL